MSSHGFKETNREVQRVFSVELGVGVVTCFEDECRSEDGLWTFTVGVPPTPSEPSSDDTKTLLEREETSRVTV